MMVMFVDGWFAVVVVIWEVDFDGDGWTWLGIDGS
jgi:hypothetical protein